MLGIVRLPARLINVIAVRVAPPGCRFQRSRLGFCQTVRDDKDIFVLLEELVLGIATEIAIMEALRPGKGSGAQTGIIAVDLIDLDPAVDMETFGNTPP